MDTPTHKILGGSLFQDHSVTHGSISPAINANDTTPSFQPDNNDGNDQSQRFKRSATLSSIDTLNIHSIDSVKFNSSTQNPSMLANDSRPRKSIAEEVENVSYSMGSQFPHSSYPYGSVIDEGYFSPANASSQRLRGATTSTMSSNNPQLVIDRKPSDLSIKSINPESPTWVFSDLLSSISSVKDKDGHQIVSKGNDLISLLSNNSDLKKDIVLKNFIGKIHYMFSHPITEVRSMGYRLVRSIITSYESLVMLIQSKILIFIIVTMSTSRSSLLEKEEALKLIRAFLTIEKGANNLSIGVVKSLIALIESENEPYPVDFLQHLQLHDPQFHDQKNQDDTKIDHYNHGEDTSSVVPEAFRNLCIETICEITLLKPELVFHSGGFKLIMDTIVNGSVEMSLCCFAVVSKTLDSQESRKFLRSGNDLVSLISVFTTSFEESNVSSGDQGRSRGPIKRQPYPSALKLQKISFLVTILLKNFNGLLAFSINGFKILSDLFSSLKKDDSTIREYIMDILFDILLIRPLPWLSSSAMGDIFSKLYNDKASLPFEEFTNLKDLTDFERNIIGHYRGLLVLILIKKVDIFQLLIGIVEQRPSPELVEKATQLITSIHSLACTHIPEELLTNKNVVMSDLSTFVIDKFSRVKFEATNEYNKNLKLQMKSLVTQSRYNIDDAEFKVMIVNTKILAVKEFEEWNWGLLLNLIQGPLTNPKRFDEILEKNPKFLKRIISFYRPFKFRFCNISIKSRNANKYINIGCQLFELLLKLDAGVQYLFNNKLLPQLSEIFAQIDPYSGIETKDPILSGRRLENTVSIGYLKFVGVLASSTRGLQILERWQFFQMFNNIIDVSMQSDAHNLFVVTLLKSVDFRIDSQFRILFSKCLRVGNFKIRSFIVRELLPKMMVQKELELFVIKNLVHNLYDSEAVILEHSINLLYEFYRMSEFENLSAFLDLSPPMHILAKSSKGKSLLYHLLDIPRGFKYLEDSGFIDNEFETVLRLEKGFTYLEKIEDSIKSILLPHFASRIANPSEDTLDFIVFLKHLLSSEDGYNYLNGFQNRDFIDLLVNSIDELSEKLRFYEEFEDGDDQYHSQAFLIKKMKQNLWIIGIITQGKYGIQLLDSVYRSSSGKLIISTIIDLFQNSTIWQIRGVCFYVIGMVSSTIEGIEILDESNWVTAFDTYDQSLSLAYPRADINSCFNVQVENPYDDLKYYSLFGSSSINTKNVSGHERRRSSELLNHVTAVQNHDTMKAENFHRQVLEDVTMQDQVHLDSDFLLSNDDCFDSQIFERVIHLIQAMNSILNRVEKRAFRELIKLKKLKPEVFGNLDLFLEVIKMIDKGSFKFHKRKFILDMFLDSKVLEHLVRKDRKPSFKS